jgi:cysteine desulfuration protein SufE
MTLEDIQKTIVHEFEALGNWEERYQHLIDLGSKLAPMPSELKTEKLLLKGCQSQVWLHASNVEGRLHLVAESDAMIVRGIVALMLRVYSDQTFHDILASSDTFLDEIGLRKHLSPTRANGLAAMAKQIRMYALAFQTLAGTTS